MIKRILEKNIKKKLKTNKAILLFGARQTGKTTLLQKIFKNMPNVLFFQADETDVRVLFENASSNRLRTLFGKNKLIIIDEAQRIKNIGLTIKLITDQIKDVQVVATGSSSFELASKIQEPLTGRKWEYNLYPISFEEMVTKQGLLEEKRMIPHRLVYGSYPEVINNPGNEKEILKQLTDSYLYKDILMIDGIKKPNKLIKLLQALSLQLGSEVNYSELGKIVGMNNETVEKYIDLLEKSFIIFRLSALNRNLRNEIKKNKKIYFYDNGIANALTSQFQNIELRKDIGALWENYVISERQKKIAYRNIWTNRFFWRTHSQKEIDYIEEKDNFFYAYEIKWNPKSKTKFSKTFTANYKNHKTKIIHYDNIEDFLL